MQASGNDQLSEALILIAEDDPTNRDIIQRQLARLGYQCEIAVDGSRALEMWRSGSYALVLSDVQMPTMDGFELTAAIRRDEALADERTPIIAITANAVNGESERCLSAGMDDFLSKPVKMMDLRGMLEKWLGPGALRPADSVNHTSVGFQSSELGTEGTDFVPIDRRVLERMFGKEPGIFREIVREFVPAAQENVKQIRFGWTERSAEKVQAAAHKLKSSARSVGAHELAETVAALEAASRADDWQAIEKGVSSIADLMREVEIFVEGL